MTDATDYAPPKARQTASLKALLPKEVPPVPGTRPVEPEDLTGMAEKLHGYLKEINTNRIYQIAASLKQLTFDESVAVGTGLVGEICDHGDETFKELREALKALPRNQLNLLVTQLVQSWSSRTVAPTMTETEK